MQQFLRGCRRPFEGAAFLARHPSLWGWAALPLAVNAVLYIILLSLLFVVLWNWRTPEADWVFWGPVGGWLAAAVNAAGAFVLKALAWLSGLLLAYFTFTTVGLAVAAPVCEQLSEAVEARLIGRPPPPAPAGWKGQARGLWRGTCGSAWLALGQLAVLLVAMPLLVIPVVGAAPMFVAGAWFAGRGFLEVPAGRRGWPRRRKATLARSRWREILGFGVAMQALFLIPLAGLLVLPVGVVAITLLFRGRPERRVRNE